MPHYYLAPAGTESGSAVKVYSSTSEKIPDRYKWSIRIADGGGCLIQSKAGGLYLSGINSDTDRTTLCLYALGTQGTEAYDRQVWRIAGEEYYVELGYGVTFDSICINIGEAKIASVNRNQTNTMWTSYTDFDYSFISGSEHVTYDAGTHKFTRISYGTARVLATHKTTGLTRTFYVLDPYQSKLVSTFGFTIDEMFLICSVYDRIDSVFSDETSTERAWKCARLFSEFCYDTPEYGIDSINIWDNVAGSVTDEDDIDDYFVNTLGYTLREFNILQSAITRNSSDSQAIDFAHMQYALAARLAYTLDKDGMASNAGAQLLTGNAKLYFDDEISYLGGWLGDAVIKESGGSTSLQNDDYCADLDAENIYRLILSGQTTIYAANSYYAGLSAASTRADVFLGYIPYETVKGMVFEELIDAKLALLSAEAAKNGDVVTELYYLNLMNNEQYHWNRIKSENSDTYDFLKSLNDRRATEAHYE